MAGLSAAGEWEKPAWCSGWDEGTAEVLGESGLPQCQLTCWRKMSPGDQKQK